MEPLKHLKNMLTHQKNQLEKQAGRLSRMASASCDPRERRSLRDESKVLMNRAKKIQARFDKLFPEKEEVVVPRNVKSLV